MIYAVGFFFFSSPFAKEPFGNVSFTLLDLSLSVITKIAYSCLASGGLLVRLHISSYRGAGL